MKKSISLVLMTVLLSNQLIQFTFADDIPVDTGSATTQETVADTGSTTPDVVLPEIVVDTGTVPSVDTGIISTTTDTGVVSSGTKDPEAAVTPIIVNLKSDPITLNSSNIASLGCDINATSCDLSNKNITSIAANTFVGYSTLQSLNLSSNQLTSIAAGTFNGLSNLTSLSITSNSTLTTLESGAFIGMPNLTSLGLQANGLTTIQANTFNGLTNLYSLGLESNNSLTTLESRAFVGMPNLTSLGMSGSPISELTGYTFSGLGNLTDLSLNSPVAYDVIHSHAFDGLTSLVGLSINNDIKKIESEAFVGMPSLTSLRLNNAPSLTELPGYTFSGLNNVTNFNISSRSLITIRSHAFDGLNNVSDLNLSGQPLTTIESEAFVGMSNLSSLEMYSSQMTEFTGYTFSGLNNLTSLGLDGSPTTTIRSHAFDGLTSLTNLSLSSLPLTSIESEAFVGMPNLTSLSFGSIQITELVGGTFSGLNNVTSLQLGGMNMYLTTIRSHAFDGLENLQGSINISGGPLGEIESGAFAGLTSLQVLSFDGDNITNIAPGTFNGLSSLQRLEIRGNQLTNLKPGIFDGLDNLQSLYLDSNQITDIQLGVFDSLVNLNQLDLSYNQITSIASGAFGVVNAEKPVPLGSYTPASYSNISYLNLSSNCLDTEDTSTLAYLDTFGAQYSSQYVCVGINYTPNTTTLGTVVGTLAFKGGRSSDRASLDALYPEIYTYTHTWQANGLYAFDLSFLPTLEVTSAENNSNKTTLLGMTSTRQQTMGYSEVTGNVDWIQTETPSQPSQTASHSSSINTTSSERKDLCPEGDYSPSYYDGLCGEDKTGHGAADLELNTAYEYAKTKGIVEIPSLEKFSPEAKMTRGELAKIISQFAVKVMGKKIPDTQSGTDCHFFTDMDKETNDVKVGVVMACKLGLMGLDSDQKSVSTQFNPDEEVTRAQLGTVISRLMWGNKYANPTANGFYTNHLDALKKDGIITNIDPTTQEIKGWTILTLYRVAQKY